MSKRSYTIREELRRIANSPVELISCTVVAGSVDMTSFTMTVQPSDESMPITGVLLHTIIDNEQGMILIPKDDSNVIIGSIDGPGQWALIKAGDLAKVMVTIDDVKYTMDNANITINKGSTILNISGSSFKINTASESLYQLLKDCFTYITELTVPTPSGASSVPTNIADFNSLITRLDNLLTS